MQRRHVTAIDPYRVLGLASGASLEEVKRAYRRLAKVAHPDASGTAATARFIALQQAYEQIIRAGRRPASVRPRGTSPRGPVETPSPNAGQRTDAGQRPKPGARPNPGARPGARPGGRPGTGGGDPAGSKPGGGSETPPRASAGLGTTTYDGADADMERPADWQGASWYGVSMGTYWTVNPKEYADPRKHGPEYLARGRGAGRAVARGAERPVEQPAGTGAPAAGPSVAAAPSGEQTQGSPARRRGLLRTIVARLRRD